MKRGLPKFLLLLLCVLFMVSFVGCGSVAKKAMDESVNTANGILEKNAKPFDSNTKVKLEKVIKSCENAKDDDAYKKAKKNIDDAVKAYQDSIKQEKQVTAPTEKFIIERMKTIKTVTKVEAATEKTDENKLLNKKGGYYSYVAMKSSMVEDSYINNESPVEAGNEGGAVVEAFHTDKDAKGRNDYLASFDGKGALSSGSHSVVGTLVIRTSDELTASQQKKLEKNIIASLIELK
ncbi:hypothetical protein AXF21_03020 [Eubacterium minutum ATCC 700079]|nr:hypothetical protein AXF21_03020 [Eubacterium minutum ATCC 700079]